MSTHATHLSQVIRALATVSVAALVTACSAQGDPGDQGQTAEEALRASARECVEDTLFFEPGMLADLRASVGPGFIKDYGPQAYPRVEIPGALVAGLPPRADGLGEYFATTHAFDFSLEDLPDGSHAKPRRIAVIGGAPPWRRGAALKLETLRYETAQSIFAAMTAASERTEDHVVPPSHVYDRSWTKIHRVSPAGRIACVSTSYPNLPNDAPDVTCTFYGVERNLVQSFRASDAGGKCLAK